MKLFITDYDGTLLIDPINLKINKRYINKLHKEGYIIVISTGRSFESIKKQVTKNKIYYDYLTCCDGAITYDKNDNLIYYSKISTSIIKELLKFNEKYPCNFIQYTYLDRYDNYYNKDEILCGMNLVYELNLDSKIKNEFIELNKLHKNYNFIIYGYDNVNYLCCKNKNVDKAYGVNYLINLLQADEVYVIGDSDNDYEMIELFNGCSIINEESKCNLVSKKIYHQCYEYMDDILNKRL